MYPCEFPAKFRLSTLGLTLAMAFPFTAMAASQESVLKCGFMGDATKNTKASYACLAQGNVSCEAGIINGQPSKTCHWPNGGAVQYSMAPGMKPTFESVGRAPVDCTYDKAGAYGYGGTICSAR